MNQKNKICTVASAWGNQPGHRLHVELPACELCDKETRDLLREVAEHSFETIWGYQPEGTRLDYLDPYEDND